jgi:hypothetical protein
MDAKFRVLKSRSAQLRDELDQIVNNDLPAALPEVYGKGPQIVPNRRKRGLFTLLASGLVTLGTEVVSHFINKKRNKAINDAVGELRKGHMQSRNALRQFREELLLYGEYTLNNTGSVIETLDTFDGRIKQLNLSVSTFENVRRAILDVDWTVPFYQIPPVAAQWEIYAARLLGQYEYVHVVLKRRLVQGLRNLLKGLATLSTGKIPPEILTHGQLADMTNAVLKTLQSRNSRYTLALEHTADYYDLALATYMIDTQRRALIVSFPVLKKTSNVSPNDFI